jgi:hypothetical protein
MCECFLAGRETWNLQCWSAVLLLPKKAVALGGLLSRSTAVGAASRLWWLIRPTLVAALELLGVIAASAKVVNRACRNLIQNLIV